MEWSEAEGTLAIYAKNREMLSILQLLLLSTGQWYFVYTVDKCIEMVASPESLFS